MNDLEWIGHANEHLPANLAALTARFVEGSRDEQWLRVSYEPGPTAFNFTALSGGSMAEVLDQAATHCGSFLTGHPCPTLTMTVTILRPGRAKRYLATGRAMKVTGVTALLAADLTDDQGHHIAGDIGLPSHQRPQQAVLAGRSRPCRRRSLLQIVSDVRDLIPIAPPAVQAVRTWQHRWPAQVVRPR